MSANGHLASHKIGVQTRLYGRWNNRGSTVPTAKTAAAARAKYTCSDPVRKRDTTARTRAMVQAKLRILRFDGSDWLGSEGTVGGTPFGLTLVIDAT